MLSPKLSTHWYNSTRFDPNDKWADFDPQTTAIVLVDLINWQAHRDGFSVQAAIEAGRAAAAEYKITRCETLVVPTLLPLLDVARSAGAKVVHVRLASRSPDCDDIVPAMREYVRCGDAQDGCWGARALPGLMADTDISITKSASGAFNSSDLDGVLRNVGAKTVMYSGVVTDLCVLLTAAGGFDLGYHQYLLTDCTAAYSDADQATGERLMARYLARAVTGGEALHAFEQSTTS